MLTDMTVVLLGIVMLTVSNGKSEQVQLLSSFSLSF